MAEVTFAMDASPSKNAAGTPSKNSVGRTPQDFSAQQMDAQGRTVSASNTPGPLFGISPFSASSPSFVVGSNGAAGGTFAPSMMASQMSATNSSVGGVKSPAWGLRNNGLTAALTGGLAGISSPNAFASIAAGVQNTLLDDSALQTSAGQQRPSDDAVAVAAMQSMDPFNALLFNAEQFTNVQLKQFQDAIKRFFDLYENAFDESVTSDAVQSAHATLLSTIDQLLATASQAGFSGLTCAGEGDKSALSGGDKSGHENDDITMAETDAKDAQAVERSQGQSRPKSPLPFRADQFASQSRETFERRERLRESASIVTNILSHA